MYGQQEIVMSSLQFKKAPARPAHISPEEWQKAWVGLEVGLATVYPMSVGYLGDIHAPQLSTEKQTHLSMSRDDIFNSWSHIQWDGFLWVSRGGLIDACTYGPQKSPLILAWLEEESQKGRKMFAVPESVAEYLP